MKAIKVTHIISGLATGGAEMMLYKLISNYPHSQKVVEHTVISLTDCLGGIEGKLSKLGIQVYSIGLDVQSPTSLTRLSRIRKIPENCRPDLIQGWMYHGNLISAYTAGLIFRKTPVLWNIRHSLVDIKREKASTRKVIYLNRILSQYPQAIIYNSNISKIQHERYGFSAKNSLVIPNGIDTKSFCINPEKGAGIRKELNIPSSAFVVGNIARFHPMKNHREFIESASRALITHPDLRFILVGRDVTYKNAALNSFIPEQFIERFHLLGERHDIPAILNALDVLCLSSSWGEGWPNVLGEAMACGVPCLATDVGDSKTIVDEYGIVVQPDDVRELTQGLLDLIAIPKTNLKELGRKGRGHIEEKYNIVNIVEQYHALYKGLIEN